MSFLMLLAIATDSTSLVMQYKDCVEKFAIGQIRSGEPAETLVRAGEAECHAFLPLVSQAKRNELLHDPAVREALNELPKEDVERVVDEEASKQVASSRNLVVEAVLRNVVFVKARITEMEGAK